MKNLKIKTIAFIAFAMVSGSILNCNAQDKKPMHDPETMLKKLDTDKDGKLSVEEFNVKAKADFEKIDKNNDGYLELKELKDFKGHGPKRNPEDIMKDLDANQDKSISEDEAKGPLKENFSKVDKNSDGLVSLDELKDHIAQRKPKR